MKNFIVSTLIFIGIGLSANASAKVSAQELYEARILKEAGKITFLMAGVAYGCGEMVQPNLKNWLYFVHGWHKAHHDETATIFDTRDWIISKTAIDYSYGVDLFMREGCQGFNNWVIDNEGVTTFTGSLLNLYQPEKGYSYGIL